MQSIWGSFILGNKTKKRGGNWHHFVVGARKKGVLGMKKPNLQTTEHGLVTIGEKEETL